MDVILNKSVELTKHSLGIMCIYSAVREELLETRKSFSDFALESLSRILNLFPFRFFSSFSTRKSEYLGQGYEGKISILLRKWECLSALEEP